ncbi:MAG: LTA synthase family protein [Clostridiales bacterium]|nr:LTA synthase family protein [Clostridiales bacterium]
MKKVTDLKKKKVNTDFLADCVYYGAQVVLLFVVPVLCFYLMEYYDRNPFEQIRQEAQHFNILIFELIGWILFFVTGRAKWSIRILDVTACIFGLVNHYVMEFRSTPLVPWDLLSIGTAASVAGEYDYTPTKRVILVVLGFLLIFTLAGLLDLKISGLAGRKYRSRTSRASGNVTDGTDDTTDGNNDETDADDGSDAKPDDSPGRGAGILDYIIKGLAIRVMPVVIAAVVLVIFAGRLQDSDFQTEHKLYPYLYTPSVMVKYNGLAVTFVMDLQYITVSKPDGYNSEEASELLSSYDTEDDSDDADTLPNIIVIMDEAFSDLAVLGDFDTNEDYMPFIHSLMEGADDTVTGWLHVSVCGGNTANTEWEFLTGNTMAFLPGGSIPFQQYVKGETPSIASHLASLGYATYAIHPYNASGWERDRVYPLLGIDTFYSLKDFSGASYIRKYVSDESSFEKVIDIYENKEDGQPVFIFNVTMQNHSSYTDEYDNFTPYITVDGIDQFSLSQYLSLIKESDAAFEALVEYFSEQDEPTVIVFFGDHQPSDSVVYKILSQNGMVYNDLSTEEEQLRYVVPYVIWANYDIEESSGGETSANYLAAEVLQTAGVELSAYQSYLLELKEEYPIISAVQIDGDEDSDTLTEYNRLQYYMMYDYEE